MMPGLQKKYLTPKNCQRESWSILWPQLGSHLQSLGDDEEILYSDFQQYKTMGWCYQATKQFLRVCKTLVARAKDLAVVHKSYRQQGPLPERPISTYPQYD